MASCDGDSLFTNIPLQETIDLCVELLFTDKPNIVGFNITDFHELLTVTIYELLLLFDGKNYKKIDGVAMGSPLGVTFANIFLSYHEQICLKNCPCNFKPVIYKRHVDGTFFLFQSKEHIEKFRCFLNCQHLDIKFTSGIEEKNSISFLDIKIRRVNNSFSTSMYRKVRFSGVFTNVKSFIPASFKSNLIFKLLFTLVTLLTFVSRDF